MCEFLIIYLYVFGFLFAAVVFAAEPGFRTKPFWIQSIIMAAWPLILPIAMLNEFHRWMHAKIKRTRRVN